MDLGVRLAEAGYVLDCVINDFQPPADLRPFDRIVSVEMFEHLRNWPRLFKRLAGWLRDSGFFFLHIFVHQELVYPTLPHRSVRNGRAR